MRDDDDDGKPNPDSDRAAILARRKQFIALALSGLATTTACTDGDGKASDSKSTRPGKARDEAKPQPCLAVPLDYQPPEPPQPDPPPQVCLKMSIPEPSGETGAAPDEPPPPKPKPQPCLSKTAPKPCLKVKRPDSD